MTEFSVQGTLSTLGTTLVTGTSGTAGFLSKLSTMRFNNPLNYTLQVYKYEASTATTILLYDLSLSGGDTVTDNLQYVLNEGDEIKAYSNIAGTTYYANGILY